MSKRTDYRDLISDPTARIVTAEEAERLEARNREIEQRLHAEAAEKRVRRERAKALGDAKRARLKPYRDSLMALKPGAECIIPPREYALAYRVGLEMGWKISARRTGQDALTVKRIDLPAALVEALNFLGL